MPRVLIAEDEYLIALSVEFLLEGAGYEILVCSNGRKALEAITDFSPDLVLTDYMMPIMNGEELIRAMRADPSLKDIPVVLITAVPERSLAERGVDYNFHLNKPADEQELLALVNSIIGEL